MTSASELFCRRRSRAGRFSDPHPPLLPPHPSPPIRDDDLRRQHRRRCRGNGHLHGHADPPPIRSRYLPQRRSNIFSENVLFSLDHQAASNSGRDNRSTDGTFGSRLDRLSLVRNDQLPSVVLQARARLVQRLRGFSLSESRQDLAVSFVSRHVIVESSDENYAENEEWSEGSFFSTNLFTGTDENIQNLSKKRPSNLSWNVIYSFHKEFFKEDEVNKAVKGSSDCSICLEKFWERDELVHLSCGHIFHPACLEPWVRISGDCPYCRARIACL